MIPTVHTSKPAIDPVTAFAYSLSERDMRCIFEELRDMGDCSDKDGERFEVDYKVYRIEAVHRFRIHEERGGDSYCGIWQMVTVVDEDRIEVVRVYDEDGRDYPELVERLNDYAKRLN